MKKIFKNKKIILSIFMAILILSLLMTYFLMPKKKDYNAFINNISEARLNFYIGEGFNYELTFSSGYRESDYKLNGYHTENIEFGVLTIKLPTELKNVNSGTFKINYGNKVINGNLQQNPFDFTLMADVGFIIGDYDKIKVTINLEDRIKIFDLINVSNNFKYNYIDALKIFIDNNYKNLKCFFDGKNFLGEVYVKIMYDKTIDSKYYYLIRIIGTKGEMTSGIINPISGEILAINTERI